MGCSLYELPEKGKSWPYHYHTANEEAIYVLSGTGSIRLDEELHPLRSGDYVALPADESGGHRVINDSAGSLRYLFVSTMCEPDVTVYPEMETLGVFVGSAPGDRSGRALHGYYPLEKDIDYWEDA
ncbi:cupin domain-containing protein [Halocatena pleomorpha]|uniref:Cupin domain-containing protein n=1 Tax=Halocatena pleomorpha TaxID=1785090 RepID=A0A3P3RIA3_9EURY|nr:cupin domain-containing protein [Halocatena pleomorpha]